LSLAPYSSIIEPGPLFFLILPIL